MRRIVIDTNVLVTAMRSDLGAAYKLVSLLGTTEKFRICVSVPLILEYEDVLNRGEVLPRATSGQVHRFLSYICSVAIPCEIFFLWRPHLRDPKDEMILELAVAGRCDTVVTYNQRDFVGAEAFGVRARTPKEFLQEIGELK